MKKLLTGWFCCQLFAANALNITCSTASFQTPSGEHFTEVYAYVIATDLAYQPLLDSRTMASIEVVYLWKQGDKIIKYDKFLLTSPVAPANTRPTNFIDLKRYAMPAGSYTLVASFTDAAARTHTQNVEMAVSLSNDASKLQMADIEPIGQATASTDEKHPYYKNGLQVEPFVLNFYPSSVSNLQFYTEIYHTDKLLNDDFAVRYFITTADGRVNTVSVVAAKRLHAQAVVPLFGSLDITQLPSGNYNLVVEVRNRASELLTTQKWQFQRSNPYLAAAETTLAKVPLAETFAATLTADSCKWSLSALLPKLNGGEEVKVVERLIEAGNLEAQQRYIFSFWAKYYPNDPRKAYLQYMAVVTELDDKFSSHAQRGHLSDRGRTYLRYGKPNAMIVQEQEQGAVPYEIWEYNKLSERQGLAKFIFYNPSLAVNDMILLHSTARGEVQDAQWQRKIYPNVQGADRDFINGENVREQMGSNKAKALFGE